MKVPLASSGLRPVDIDAAINVINSGNLTMGENVLSFETQMASYLGVSHFTMMNSGSSANLAIFEALLRPAIGEPHLLPGDGVIVPAIAWPTTIWPIIQLGLKPIFVDIDANTLGIDLHKTEVLIGKKENNVKAIFPIHPLGRALDNKKILEICNKYNLILLNDVCESLGSWLDGKHTGTSGLAGSFSFYFSHHITTMEGGGVCTNSETFANDLRSIRSHGWSRDRKDVAKWNSKSTRNDAKFLFITSGFNVRPMEIQAAIGLTQLKDLGKFIERRKQIANYIDAQLVNSDYKLIGSEVIHDENLQDSHSWMLLPIQSISDKGIEGKRKMLNHFENNEIETRPVLTGNFLDQPAMKRIYSESPDPRNFPIADNVSNTTFLIGAHHDLSDSQVEFIGEKISEVVNAK
jgi:CDP-6-deoxy-D-xylo-4-hexulose-3-dehydrase